MENRCYSKAELATYMLPHISVHAAVNRLMSWINLSPELVKQLESTGYRKRQRHFTSTQVKLIADALVIV